MQLLFKHMLCLKKSAPFMSSFYHSESFSDIQPKSACNINPFFLDLSYEITLHNYAPFYGCDSPSDFNFHVPLPSLLLISQTSSFFLLDHLGCFPDCALSKMCCPIQGTRYSINYLMTS